MTDESNSLPNLTPTSPDGLPNNPPGGLPPNRPPSTTSTTPASRVPAWRFLAAMLLQSALIVAVPFQSALTYSQGETITLQTAPVDPYDLLRGYSQTLSFDISNPNTLKALPGGEEVLTWKNQGELIYVTLAEPEEAAPDPTLSVQPPPTAWTPVAVSLALPEALEPGQVALRGRYGNWRILYGLETYYMPEAQRDDINETIRQLQRTNDEAFVVDVKVDAKGNSVPLSLWIEGEPYQF